MIRNASIVCIGIAGLLAACATEETSPARVRKGAPTSSWGGESGTPGTTVEAGGTSGGSDTTPGTSAPGSTAPPELGEVKQGIATFYDADGSGNCSFPASPENLMVVAPNKAKHYNGSAACGACLKVTGSKGSVVVRVVDSCPLDTPDNDCGDTNADLDLSAQAFAAIEDPSVGITPVTFQVVPCEVDGPMRYRFKSGSSQWWTAVQVRNHREPVSKVEYAKDGGWVAMTREDDNYFVEPNGVGPRPNGLPLRITSVTGKTVQETLLIDDSKTLVGQQQFD